MFDGFGFCPIVRFEWHASFGIARWKLKGQLGETRDDRRGAMWKNNETCTKRARTIAIFRVFDREMEENADVYECSNEMYNFPLGINFFCVFPYEEWIDSLLEWIIIYFYFNPLEFVRDAYRVTEKRAVISSEQHFVSIILQQQYLRRVNF